MHRISRVIYGPSTSKIKELTLFDVETGSILTEEERIARNIKEPLVMYVGVATMIQTLATPIGPGKFPFEFPFLIEASSLKEAFDIFPKKVEELQADIREQEEKMIEHIKQMQEAEKKGPASKIVTATKEDLNALKNAGLKLVK